MSDDPLTTLRELAEADPEKWGPALAEHERQLQSLPPVWKQVVNFTTSVASLVAEGLPMVTEDVREARLEVCRSCPRYIPDQGRCAACGCYVSLKAWMGGSATCPEGRWAH